MSYLARLRNAEGVMHQHLVVALRDAHRREDRAGGIGAHQKVDLVDGDELFVERAGQFGLRLVVADDPLDRPPEQPALRVQLLDVDVADELVNLRRRRQRTGQRQRAADANGLCPRSARERDRTGRGAPRLPLGGGTRLGWPWVLSPSCKGSGRANHRLHRERRGSRQLVDRLRPVALSSRDSERSASSLPPVWQRGAVVRLVVGVDDALHRRAADRARLAEAPCTAISGRNAVTFSGKPSPTSAREPLGPLRAGSTASRRTAARSAVASSARRQRHGRESRAVQDLVGVGVADAAEQARIGERALQRVILAARAAPRTRRGRRRARRGRRGRTRASARSPRTTWSDARRLRAGLGEQQRARVELERRERERAGQLRARRVPLQPAGDHQVDHDEQLALERDHDALAEPLDASTTPSLRLRRAADRPCAARTGSRAGRARAVADDARARRST